MTHTATRMLHRLSWAHLMRLARPLAPRMLRFACTGVLAGGVQLAILHLWLAWDWNALLANTVAYLVSAQVNFLLSETFTWRDRHGDVLCTRTLLRRWVTFHGAIFGTALLNQAVFVTAETALPPLVASAIGIVAGALINFLMQDRLVFQGTTGTTCDTGSYKGHP